VLVIQSLKLFHGLPQERLRMVVVMARNEDGTGESCEGEGGPSWWTTNREPTLPDITVALKPTMT
jgi:hypothetical protein